MAQPTEKTRWNSKVEAWQVHNALTGLLARFKANELDGAPVEKALKALAPLAKEVQDVRDAALQAKAEYHQSVSPHGDAMESLRKENEALRARLAAASR